MTAINQFISSELCSQSSATIAFVRICLTRKPAAKSKESNLSQVFFSMVFFFFYFLHVETENEIWWWKFTILLTEMRQKIVRISGTTCACTARPGCPEPLMWMFLFWFSRHKIMQWDTSARWHRPPHKKVGDQCFRIQLNYLNYLSLGTEFSLR